MVLTDGVENRSRLIADVAAQINEHTYAVGLGTPQNTSAAALQTISGNNGGYLLVTGAIGTDNRFLLQKYFLQILAGISNAEVVLDPDGQLIRARCSDPVPAHRGRRRRRRDPAHAASEERWISGCRRRTADHRAVARDGRARHALRPVRGRRATIGLRCRRIFSATGPSRPGRGMRCSRLAARNSRGPMRLRSSAAVHRSSD